MTTWLIAALAFTLAGWYVNVTVVRSECRDLRLRLAELSKNRLILIQDLRRLRQRQHDIDMLQEKADEFYRGLEEAVAAHMLGDKDCPCDVCRYIRALPSAPVGNPERL